MSVVCVCVCVCVRERETEREIKLAEEKVSKVEIGKSRWWVCAGE